MTNNKYIIQKQILLDSDSILVMFIIPLPVGIT